MNKLFFKNKSDKTFDKIQFLSIVADVALHRTEQPSEPLMLQIQLVSKVGEDQISGVTHFKIMISCGAIQIMSYVLKVYTIGEVISELATISYC